MKIEKMFVAAMVVLFVVNPWCSEPAVATPIDFDNLNVASTTYGIVAGGGGGLGGSRLMAAYNNDIYFIVMQDGTATPSKVYRYDPSDGWSNSANHSIVRETTGKFVTLRKIDGLLYFSDNLGNVYFYDGTTPTEMLETPFTASDYVSSIVEFNGLMYFATSAGNIFRYNEGAFEQVDDIGEDRLIIDMVPWQKDGYLYVSVGPSKACCPPTGYLIRSSTGDTGSWANVFSGFRDIWQILPTPDYLYAGVLDTSYSCSSTVRKSSNGTDFPIIYGPDGQYKRAWGSFYYDGIAYIFADDHSNGLGKIIVDENGSVNCIPNQNWTLTQAVELNGEVYALACSPPGELPGDVYLITTNILTVVSPDGGEELVAGQIETIIWNSVDDINNVKIEFSDSNGISWDIVDSNTINDGQYNWPLPEITSNQCLVRISDVNDANIYDTSDDVFTIFRCLHPVGDLNNDCFVDFFDFALMAANWLKSGNIDDGLVAYWSFDEGSGMTAHDVVGGNNGTLNGDPNWVDGISGKALYFDGSGDYVEVPNSPDLNPTSAITVTAWINVSSYPGSWPAVVAKVDKEVTWPPGYALAFTTEDETIHFGADHEGQGATSSSAVAIPLDGPHFVVGSYDGSAFMLYVDAVAEAPMYASGNLHQPTGNLRIGHMASTLPSVRYFHGLIDEVRIYNRALSEAEIQYLYENP